MSRARPGARQTAELRRLHFVNALFSQITGDNLYLAQQISRSIAFSLSELEENAADNPELVREFDAAFYRQAALLLEQFCTEGERRGFFHWDAANTRHAATPLFARAELMAGLRELARFKEATLLVTNLRPALVPAGKRATPKRKREYAETLAFIRELAASRTARNANLQLLFL